jgi:hypothetical protein
VTYATQTKRSVHVHCGSLFTLSSWQSRHGILAATAPIPFALLLTLVPSLIVLQQSCPLPCHLPAPLSLSPKVSVLLLFPASALLLLHCSSSHHNLSSEQLCGIDQPRQRCSSVPLLRLHPAPCFFSPFSPFLACIAQQD